MKGARVIDKLKQLMLELITTNNGITDIAMSLKLMQQLNPSSFSSDEFMTALKELLASEDLISLRYYDPASNRAKYILFCYGTKLEFEAGYGKGSSSSQEDMAAKSS
jgi:hypothetical protein